MHYVVAEDRPPIDLSGGKPIRARGTFIDYQQREAALPLVRSNVCGPKGRSTRNEPPPCVCSNKVSAIYLTENGH